MSAVANSGGGRDINVGKHRLVYIDNIVSF